MQSVVSLIHAQHESPSISNVILAVRKELKQDGGKFDIRLVHLLL